MLQVARLAPRLLDEAAEPITEFLQSQWCEDGGAADRAGNSDLYYTVFVLEGLLALQAAFDAQRVRNYLRRSGDGATLDFVHHACLARAWACLPEPRMDRTHAHSMAARIEACRSSDGGYAAQPGADRGTLYNCFLAMGLYQDLGLTMPNAKAMEACIQALRTKDGAYANEPGLMIGTTPGTAAAIALLRQIECPVPDEAGEWLLGCAHPGGGFVATRFLQMPDLLSTATTLHALAAMHVDFSQHKESCLDFLDSLWTGKAFCGSWEDDAQDSEYTYYALLALGHLSL